MSTRARFLGIVVCAALLSARSSRAEPVAVAHAEGVAHGFLTLRSLDGSALGEGDLIQTASGKQVTAKLIFRFKDGSTREETTVYTQERVFRLLSNHVTQKGPSFKTSMDASIDARSGRVRIRYADDHGEEKVIDRQLEVPDDLSNGLMLVLLKNISPATDKTTVSMLAMTPDPRLVKLEFTPGGEDSFSILGAPHKALRYVVKVNVPGPTGAIASLLGKTPPDSQVWIVGGEAPTFVKAESSVYSGGALWRIELASPVWRSAASREARRKIPRKSRSAR